MTYINKTTELSGKEASSNKTGTTKVLPEGKLPQRNAKDLGTSGAFLPSMYTGNAMAKAKQKIETATANVDTKKTKTKSKKPKEGKTGAPKLSKKSIKIPISSGICSKTRRNEGAGVISNIAVIDYFNGNNDLKTSTNPTNRSDISYLEEIMEEYIAKGANNIHIERFDIKGDENTLREKIDIIKKGTNGQKFNAVNMSISCDMSYSNIESELGVTDVTPDNLASKRDEILNAMSTNEDYRNSYKTIAKIEELIKDGTPVYVASGNGETDFNLFSLAKGSISVQST